MTNEQIKQANAMNDSGISWSIIASYYGLTTTQLLKERKHYDKQTTKQAVS